MMLGLGRREGVHLRGEELPPPKKAYGAKPPNLKAKAVLLSGPPGIGKTSAASIVTRCALDAVAIFARQTS